MKTRIKTDWWVLFVIVVILSAVFINRARADNLDACMSGAYYDPARIGEGVVVEVLDADRMVVMFYTFGSNGLVWYSMTGSGVMPMYGTRKISEVPFKTITAEVGTGVISLRSDGALTFKYDLTLDADSDTGGTPWCFGGHCTGEYTYTRLTRTMGCE